MHIKGRAEAEAPLSFAFPRFSHGGANLGAQNKIYSVPANKLTSWLFSLLGNNIRQCLATKNHPSPPPPPLFLVTPASKSNGCEEEEDEEDEQEDAQKEFAYACCRRLISGHLLYCEITNVFVSALEETPTIDYSFREK